MLKVFWLRRSSKSSLDRKGLAVFLPAYILSLIASCVVVLAVNYAVALPGWGMPVLPGPALVNGLIVNPLLFFGLLAFIILFSLANNPDIAIAPSFILGFGLMIGMPVGLLTGAIDVASWSFTLWYAVGTIVVLLIVLYLTRLLSGRTLFFQ